MQLKKIEALAKAIMERKDTFCAASYKHGVSGIAFDIFDVKPRTSWTREDWNSKMAEILRIEPQAAYAIDGPGVVPPQLLKYVPAYFAANQLHELRAGATPREIVLNYAMFCGGIVLCAEEAMR